MPRDGELRTLELLGGRSIPLRLKVSPRARRITLRLDPAIGGAVVTYPRYAAKRDVLEFVERNQSWLLSRLARLPRPVPFAEGEEIPILGRPHVIRGAPWARRGVWAEHGALWVSGAPEFTSRRVTDHLKKQAKAHLSDLVMEKAAKLPEGAVRPRRIGVRDTTSRWGSCTEEGNLSFCWRLILAPEAVADYVAAHEVAHLKHLDHSPAFWRLCGALSQDMAFAKTWLKDEGGGLQLYG